MQVDLTVDGKLLIRPSNLEEQVVLRVLGTKRPAQPTFTFDPSGALVHMEVDFDAKNSMAQPPVQVP